MFTQFSSLLRMISATCVRQLSQFWVYSRNATQPQQVQHNIRWDITKIQEINATMNKQSHKETRSHWANIKHISVWIYILVRSTDNRMMTIVDCRGGLQGLSSGYKVLFPWAQGITFHPLLLYHLRAITVC